jgi:hypothetical protein
VGAVIAKMIHVDHFYIAAGDAGYGTAPVRHVLRRRFAIRNPPRGHNPLARGLSPRATARDVVCSPTSQGAPSALVEDEHRAPRGAA